MLKSNSPIGLKSTFICKRTTEPSKLEKRLTLSRCYEELQFNEVTAWIKKKQKKLNELLLPEMELSASLPFLKECKNYFIKF